MNEHIQKQIVHSLLEKGFLPGPDLLQIHDLTPDAVLLALDRVASFSRDLLIVNKDLYSTFHHLSPSAPPLEVNWLDFDHTRVLLEKKNNTKPYHTFLETFTPHITPPPSLLQSPQDVQQHKNQIKKELVMSEPSVLVLKTYDEPSRKRTIKDFVSHYKHRYDFSVALLRNRIELVNLISINRIKKKQDRESVSVIGLVYDKMETKQGNIILTLEDTTGHVRVFAHKNGPLQHILPLVTYDEVIGVSGHMKNNLLFANTLLFPDIPVDHKGTTTPDDVCAVFISDVHVGSKMFLEKEFIQFIHWLNGEVGTDAQKALASKVQYLFVVGDVVDGVGVYPKQEAELLIPDIYKQYSKTKELLSQIRKDITIIMCPGNHDAMRIAEPQPAISTFSSVLAEMNNVILLSNPALVKIHHTKESEGVSVLMYHGYSYDYYAATIEPIRTGGAYDRIDLLMKYLLQKRHLAPSHTSTLYLPGLTHDPLLIDTLPDIFVSGHVHKSAVGSYNGVLLIGCSCWQAKTSFQEKLGHNPDPGRVPVVNLKTREVILMNFLESEV